MRVFFGLANDRVRCDTVLHRAEPEIFATCAHVGDFRRDPLRRVTMHDVGVTCARDQLFRCRTFTAGVDRRTWTTNRLRFENGLFHSIVMASVTDTRLAPYSVHNAQPFVGSSVAVVVLLEVDPIASSFVFPPRRDDIEREPPARDPIDVRSLLGENRRLMKRWPNGDHQLEPLGNRCERRRGGPSLERISI